MVKKSRYLGLAIAYGIANLALGGGTYDMLVNERWIGVLGAVLAFWSILDYAQDVNRGRTTPPRGWAMLPVQSTQWDVLAWSWREVVVVASAWVVVWGLWLGEDATVLLGLIGGVLAVLMQHDAVSKVRDAELP